MMMDFEKNKDLIIDEFYNEEPGKISDSLKSSEEYFTFKEKLKLADEKLKLLDAEEFNYEINLEDIIDKAFEIRTGRKSKIEFILFLLLSTVILSIFIMMSLKFGIRAFLISQVAFISILPWSLIPISILRAEGSEL